MNDFLLEIGQNPTARKLIKGLGLPLPMPQKLRRARGPWAARPLQDDDIIVGAGPGAGPLLPVIARTLATAGANPWLVDDRVAAAFAEVGEAYGRPARRLSLDDDAERPRYRALLFDASGVADPSGLRAVYDFFHPLVRGLAKCGRVVVLGRPADQQGTPEAAAAQAGLSGFVRSLAKELGKRGSTAQLLEVEDGAEARAAGVLRFVLGARSAFVTGQPIRVSAKARDTGGLGDVGGAPSWVRSLEGKVALVTGAARGIGAATVRLLAAEGAHVVCLDRPQDDALASKIAREVGGSVLLADVSDPDSPQRIRDDLRSRFDGVDIVIHNAGVTRDKTLARMKPEKWDQALDINLGAVARITRALTEGDNPVLRDGGRLVCLSSVAGIAGNVGQTNYAASKAGIIGFVHSEARALAARGITVNAVAPGFIETRLTAAIPVVIREVGRRLSALGQGGLPGDVGEVLTFLSTPMAQGITGGVVRVCGGAFIGA